MEHAFLQCKLQEKWLSYTLLCISIYEHVCMKLNISNAFYQYFYF